MALGKATVNIMANLKPLQRGLKNANAAIKSMVKRAGSAMRAGFRASFKVITAGFRNIIRLAKLAAAAIIGIGIASVKIASDVQETENLFRISMGKMAASAQKWATSYSKSLNLFENDTRKALGTFQLMLTSMGIAEDEAFKMSKGLVKLTNDISSFRNLKPDEVFLKLAAGITGESEPLKRIGILVNETIIKQLALTDATIKTEQAIKKGTVSYKRYGNRVIRVQKSTSKVSKELTNIQKVMLRYKAIVNATTKDQGDMSRTLDELANVFRQVWAQIKKTGETIGNVLLPNVTKVSIALREWLKGSQGSFEKWAKVANDGVELVAKELMVLFNLAKTGDFKGLGARLAETLEKVAGVVRKLLVKFAPIAFDIGKSIGDGFWSSFKDTKVGKLLDVGNPVTLGKAAFRHRQSQTRTHGTEFRIGSLMDRATGERTFNDRDSDTSQKMLDELRKMNGVLMRETQGAF
jgi:hypothetical protein